MPASFAQIFLSFIDPRFDESKCAEIRENLGAVSGRNVTIGGVCGLLPVLTAGAAGRGGLGVF